MADSISIKKNKKYSFDEMSDIVQNLQNEPGQTQTAPQPMMNDGYAPEGEMNFNQNQEQ